MQKIPTLFQRDFEVKVPSDPMKTTCGRFLVRDEVTPGCEWVIAGQGVATRKWDGATCLVKGGRLYRRLELRGMYVDHVVDGREVWACKQDIPEDFEPAGEVDPKTGRQQGWVPVGGESHDRYYLEAFIADFDAGFPDGTYELCGPKINGNPEKFKQHVLVRHGQQFFWPQVEPARTFAGIRDFLSKMDIEGVVYHHPDGRMAKIKGRDFGLTRPK